MIREPINSKWNVKLHIHMENKLNEFYSWAQWAIVEKNVALIHEI